MADESETPVIFRIERRKGGQVTAVFPCEAYSLCGNFMSCYSHIGQHSRCSFGWYTTGKHRAATPEEYASLKRELESAPYNYKLKVYQRLNPKLRRAFHAELDRLRELDRRISDSED